MDRSLSAAQSLFCYYQTDLVFVLKLRISGQLPSSGRVLPLRQTGLSPLERKAPSDGIALTTSLQESTPRSYLGLKI